MKVWGVGVFGKQICSANEDRDCHLSWCSRKGYVFLEVCCHLDFEEPTSVKGCGRCKTSDVTPKPVVSERMSAALPGLYGFLRRGGQGNWAVPSYPVFLLGDAGEAVLHSGENCSCSKVLLGLPSQGILLLWGAHCFVLHPSRFWW